MTCCAILDITVPIKEVDNTTIDVIIDRADKERWVLAVVGDSFPIVATEPAGSVDESSGGVESWLAHSEMSLVAIMDWRAMQVGDRRSNMLIASTGSIKNCTFHSR